MIVLIFSSGENSTPFNMSSGQRHGCVLAPFLSNIFFMSTLSNTLCNSASGAYLWYRQDGSLFNLRWLNVGTRTLELLIMEALLTDDYSYIAHVDHKPQMIISRFAEVSHLNGLTISLSKAEVIH